MTATHILARWRRIAATGILPSQWLIFLAIAEAGPDGIDAQEVAAQFDVIPNTVRYMTRHMMKAGHIRRQLSRNQPLRGGRPRFALCMQPSGYALLGIDPPATAHTSRLTHHASRIPQAAAA